MNKKAGSLQGGEMRLPIYIEGKKYRLSYYKYIAYHSLKRIERLEKKIAQLENELKSKFTER